MIRKKIRLHITAIFAMLFIICCLCTGCINHETPQIAYGIGEEHTFGAVKVKVEHDEVQEQFIINFNISEQDTDSCHRFHFTFTYDSISLRNSEQFDYFDETGSEIKFDENGYYLFYTNKVFHVSYKYASTDVKRAIDDKTCSLDFGMGTFYFWPLEAPTLISHLR